MLSENDIARIADRITLHFVPLATGVFGSYAIGAAHERSDLDLFIIKKRGEWPTTTRHAVRRLLFGVLHPLDIQVFTPVEFEEAANEALSFAWVIVGQARLYHWKEEAIRLVPSLFVRPDGRVQF